MLVRYKKREKYTYKGNQYLQGAIIDIDNFDEVDKNKFEFLPKAKAHIDLVGVKNLLKTIESDLENMKRYHKQYKDRETELLKIVNGTTVKEVTVKSAKIIKKEVI